METGAIKRRLTAILAADAVGYSRHMSVDEEGTMRELAAHRAVIDRIIAAREGRIVGTAGDSVLAEFASPVEAVRCAVEMQEAIHTRNETLPEAARLLFRIGVNLGDVMIDGADILGDGVNVAARLEGIADPGGILISSSVYDQVAGKLSLGFEDLGERSLKNITRPIRVYRFDRSGVRGGEAPGGSKRKFAFAGGGLVLVAIVVAGLWQAGVFPMWTASKPAPPPVPVATAPVVTPPVAAPASEDMKLKLQIAEAERAKAEAELAKSRSEADAAKQRSDAEAAKQRAAAKGASTERKDPALPAAPAPAPTPTLTAAAPSPAVPVGASPQPAITTPAAQPPSPGTPDVVAKAPITTAMPPAEKAAAELIASIASGRGTAIRQCDAFEESKPLRETLPVRVEAGEIVVERGTKGSAGYLLVRGKPSTDGQLSLVGTGISANKRNFGKQNNIYFTGAIANGSYELKGRTGQRACTLTVGAEARP